MILAIDTSTDICSVSVIENEKQKSKNILNTKQLHAEKLILIINQTLENINITLKDIKAIAVSIGPGSFTGLRISLSVAKGLCYVLGKPLIAVPTLDALALRAKQFCNILKNYIHNEIFVCAVLNAKQSDFYFSFYKYESDQLVRVSNYLSGGIDEIKKKISGLTVFIGDGVEILREKFYSQDTMIFLEDEINCTDAFYVATIAEQKYKRGEFSDIETIEPIYVKEFLIKTK
ncbi:tRNA threonylcarbamoyladenosine biosynthesis protein TsaB [Candidatus Kryptobacter tengchongensis]|nr:tRNA threonylcarbamoyladenosine biosynthesis protein TsaB [Candidatus Kryptobacter tengchongensis]